MAFQHPTALGRIWTLGTTVSGHAGARRDAAAGTANATTATTATRAAVASRLPRTIAPCTPGRRRACRRRDTPYADNRRSRGRAGPVRESQHTAHRHRPQVSAEVAPSTSRIARTRDNPPRSTTGRDMRMGHPAFQSSLPRSSSSVGLSVKGARACRGDGWRGCGQQNDDLPRRARPPKEPRAGAGRDLTGPWSARRLAREPGWIPRRRGLAAAPVPRRSSSRSSAPLRASNASDPATPDFGRVPDRYWPSRRPAPPAGRRVLSGRKG